MLYIGLLFFKEHEAHFVSEFNNKLRTIQPQQ